jgi:hypothetical protein
MSSERQVIKVNRGNRLEGALHHNGAISYLNCVNIKT